MNSVHEDGVMIPDSVVLREVHHASYYTEAETRDELFGDAGLLNETSCMEPIDNDPTIEVVLASYGL